MISSYFTWNDFVFKRHYCPICRLRLLVKKTTKIFDARSKEAKEFDFNGDKPLFGQIEVTYHILYCECCDKEYESKQISQYERSHKISTVYSNKESFFYRYLKNHYCPKCKSLLRVKYNSKIIDLNTKRNNLSKEEVEDRIGFFYCANCGFEILFGDMKKHEKSILS